MSQLCHYGDDSLYIQHALDEKPEQDSFVMHAHDMYEMLYFISGHATYLVESTAYPLSANSALLMRPGEVHRLKIEESVPYERIVLYFREERLTDSTIQYRQLLAPFNEHPLGSDNLYRENEIDCAFVYRCLRRIIAPNQYQEQDMLKLLATTLLPAILGEFYCSYIRRRDTIQTDEVPEHNRIRNILRYVNAHLFEDLSLDVLCDRFYISKAQLSRLFRYSTGSTAWDYIIIKRLIEARRQILAGIPITDVALRCGFKDYSAFYRAYKKRYGCAPAMDRSRIHSDY